MRLNECIRIRPITEKDTDLIVKWRNEFFVRKNFIYQEDFTKEGHLKWYHEQILTKKVYQFIISNTVENKDIGSIYLRDIDLLNQKAEYGIFIGESDYLGKGVGTEAGRQLLNFAFNTLGLNKVYLRVFSFNKQAITSYKKIGFKVDGVFRDDVFINGTFQDIVFMSILKGEYHEKY